MKLYEYLSLMPEGNELTVWDKDYSTEMYFYSDRPDGPWSVSMWKLSGLLTVTKIDADGVTVNLSELVKKRLDRLEKADLFISCKMEDIMENLNDYFFGNKSETWMQRFVEALL